MAYQKQEKGSCPKTTWKGVGPGHGVVFSMEVKKGEGQSLLGLSEGCLFMPPAEILCEIEIKSKHSARRFVLNEMFTVS